MKRELPARIKDKAFSITNLYVLKFKYLPPANICVNNVEFRLPKKLGEETKEYLASTLVKGNACIFGYESGIKLYKHMDSGYQNRYWWKIDISKLQEDPKYIWEVNRHQFLPVWALAFHFEDYALLADMKFREYISKWMAANPPEKGLNWCSNLEIAVRAISWALSYWIRKPAKDDFWDEFLKVLYHHGVHIEQHLFYSRACIPNNHLLGEVSALTILGILFNKAEWIDYRHDLEMLISKQFYDDGVNFEQSINYHKFSLQFIILVNILLKKIGVSFKESSQRVIERAGEFIQWTKKPNGSWPNIGDNDNGMVCRLPGKRDAHSDDGGIHVLRSAPKLELPDSQPYDPKGTCKAFPQGGYYIKRTGWGADDSFLLIKCGPHLYHAHADLLHLEYSFKGEDVFVDSGTFQYNNVRALRRYFRGTFAHNTVAIPKHDQSRQYKIFRWLQKAAILSIKHDESLNRFEALIEYGTCKVLHKRIMKTNDSLDNIQLIDEIHGSSKAYLLLHIEPGNRIELFGNSAQVITTKGNEIQVEFFTKDQITVCTAELPYSTNYGVLKKHQAIIVSIRGAANSLKIQTRVRAFENNQ
ncbi:MAG: alginate lyase family protein [Peptococcaceae bacterium]|nr:heparinase II/III family protein [Peptococcaceae bacterium]MDH7524531.1 alginate lyase family protein [Peptococcaceae bacterium]